LRFVERQFYVFARGKIPHLELHFGENIPAGELLDAGNDPVFPFRLIANLGLYSPADFST